MGEVVIAALLAIAVTVFRRFPPAVVASIKDIATLVFNKERAILITFGGVSTKP